MYGHPLAFFKTDSSRTIRLAAFRSITPSSMTFIAIGMPRDRELTCHTSPCVPFPSTRTFSKSSRRATKFCPSATNSVGPCHGSHPPRQVWREQARQLRHYTEGQRTSPSTKTTPPTRNSTKHLSNGNYSECRSVRLITHSDLVCWEGDTRTPALRTRPVVLRGWAPTFDIDIPS